MQMELIEPAFVLEARTQPLNKSKMGVEDAWKSSNGALDALLQDDVSYTNDILSSDGKQDSAFYNEELGINAVDVTTDPIATKEVPDTDMQNEAEAAKLLLKDVSLASW